MSTDLDFTPHPGSRLAMAGRDHQPTLADVAGEQALHPRQPSMHAVPTRIERPEEGIWRTAVIAGSGARQLIPQDPARYRTLILAVDGDIVLCSDKDKATEAANQASGPLVQPQAPASGSNFVYTVPNPCQLASAYFQLVTSASVGNRFVNIMIADANGNTIAVIVNNTATPASSTTKFSAAQGLGQVTSAGQASAALPTLQLQPGWTITIGASGILAGDQVSAITLMFSPSYAQAPIGFYLPKGIVLPVEDTGLCWAANPQNVPVRVSVKTEHHAHARAH